VQLRLHSEACQVEEAAFVPGVEEDAILRLSEGVAKQQREERRRVVSELGRTLV